MAVVPGISGSGMSTLDARYPPISDYSDLHKVNIVVDLEMFNAQNSVYLKYNNGSVDTITSITKNASKTIMLNNCRNTLNNIALRVSRAFGVANPIQYSYAYEIGYDGSKYYVKRLALYNLVCINWILTSGIFRSFVFVPLVTNLDPDSVVTAGITQWGNAKIKSW